MTIKEIKAFQFNCCRVIGLGQVECTSQSPEFIKRAVKVCFEEIYNQGLVYEPADLDAIITVGNVGVTAKNIKNLLEIKDKENRIECFDLLDEKLDQVEFLVENGYEKILYIALEKNGHKAMNDVCLAVFLQAND